MCEKKIINHMAIWQKSVPKIVLAWLENIYKNVQWNKSYNLKKIEFFIFLIFVLLNYKKIYSLFKMADTADAPTVKDLPKLDDHIKDEIVKDVQLKHIEVQSFTLWLFLVQDMWVSVTICFGNWRNSKSLGSYSGTFVRAVTSGTNCRFQPMWI